MASYTVTNEALGARGVGLVLVDAGATVDVELTDDEALLLGEMDGVTVAAAGAKRGRPAKVVEETAPAAEEAAPVVEETVTE